MKPLTAPAAIEHKKVFNAIEIVFSVRDARIVNTEVDTGTRSTQTCRAHDV